VKISPLCNSLVIFRKEIKKKFMDIMPLYSDDEVGLYNLFEMDLAAVFDDVESIAFSGCAVRLTARRLVFFICFPFFTVLVLSRAVLALMKESREESLVLQVSVTFCGD
jgi:hypothetical protein